MAKYPIYLEVGGKKAVVIGAGSVASRKVEALCKAGANVVVVAKQIQKQFSKRCCGLDIKIIEDDYSKEYLGGALIVIAATNDNNLNSRIYSDCKDLNIICNAVDVPELCDFYVPAVIRRNCLSVAIATEGKSPLVSQRLRRELQQHIPKEYGEFVELLGGLRTSLKKTVPDGQRRHKIMEALVSSDILDLLKAGKRDLVQKRIKQCMSSSLD